MNRIAEIFRDSNIPLIIIRKAGETASDETTLHSFSDGDNGYAIISNSTELHSPVTGEQLTPLEGLSETTKDPEAVNTDKLSEMASDLEGHQLFMDMELAFDLSGETIKSPLTGKDMILAYASAELADDDSEEDEAEENADGIEEDVVNDVDSEEEEEIPDSDFDVVEDESLDEDSPEAEVIDEDPDSEVDDSADTEDDLPESDDDEEDDAGELASDDEEETPPEAIAPDATLTLESELDADKPLRLVQTDASGSEVAVFNGANYLGSMSRSKAATNTQPLFDNGGKLYSAFKSVVTNNTNLRSPEVAAFGFEPQQIKVEVSKVIADAIEQAKVEVASSLAEDRKALSDRFKKAVSMSLLGISKGFFEGASSLVGETASVLNKAGVVNAERTVRKSLVKHSESFTTAVMEKASELVDQSDDYLRGISESITNADVKGDVTEITTVFEDPKPNNSETAGFVRTHTKPSPQGNRFAKLVGGIGRR